MVWFDRESGEDMYCTGFEQLPAPLLGLLIDPTLYTTPSIPNWKTFDFFSLKFDHSSYSKNLCANIVKFKLFLKNFY